MKKRMAVIGTLDQAIEPTNGAMADSRPVIHLTSGYPPDLGGTERVDTELGGLERVVTELTEALALELEAPVEVVTGTRRGHHGSSMVGHVVVHRLRSFYAVLTPIIPGLAWYLLRAPRPRLLHIHVAHAGTPEIGALVARLRGIPIIAHVHIDASPTTWMGVLLAPYQKLVLARMLRQATMVVVPTDSYRSLLIKKYRLDPDRVNILPNGTQMSQRASTETRAILASGPVRLVNVGRIAKEKNHELLIDAIEHLITVDGLDVELEIVGDGPVMEQVANYICARGLESRIRMSGYRVGDDLVESYDRADIFVLTSTSESFGMVVVEAMARGVPVIAPNITGIRDVVIDGKSGLLTDNTVETISDAVLRLIREPGLREDLLAGAKEQCRRYEWPEIARRCASLYQQLVPASASG
jgi:glycosyltransferase involved in cell wall biosynthesis